MPDTTVKYFNSSMTGAPTLTDAAGTLIAVLDACLIDGFGSVTLNSLSVVDHVATATVSNGHGFAMVGNAGPVVAISGATPSSLNDTWRIASIPNSTTFTFATAGIADQAATGTIAARRAPAGWTKAHTGTNKAAYARPADATAMLWWINDLDYRAEMLMYEDMTDIDTGSGVTPTSGVAYCSKALIGSAAGSRAWRLFADGATVYLFIDNQSATAGTWSSGVMFGDLQSYKSGDAYRCVLIGTGDGNNNYAQLQRLNNTAQAWVARRHDGAGAAVALARYSHGKTPAVFSTGGPSGYPNPVDNSLLAWPVEAWETVSGPPRGVLPGIYNVLYPAAPHDAALVVDAGAAIGRTLLVQRIFSPSGDTRAALDLTGPWR